MTAIGLKALLYLESVGMKGWDGQSPATQRHQKGKTHTVAAVMDKVASGIVEVDLCIETRQVNSFML